LGPKGKFLRGKDSEHVGAVIAQPILSHMYLQSIEITGALGKNYEIPAAVSVVDDVLLANGQRSQRYANVFGAFFRLLISIDGRRKPSPCEV